MRSMHVNPKLYSVAKKPDECVSYKSGQKTVSRNNTDTELETGEKRGIKHTWTGYLTENCQAILTWIFDWDDLKIQGVDRLVGNLIVKSVNGYWNPVRVIIDWTHTDQTILAMIGSGSSSYAVTFEYDLTAHYAKLPRPEKISFGEMFSASDKTDVILVVEGKKLYVNKAFLSFHSDYFSTLFSSNFKEGQMKEIEIKEVSYEDFGLLLASFYPNPQFPNGKFTYLSAKKFKEFPDHTVEKLIEMASRFQVSSVIRIVEYHLLHNSRIGYEKMLWLADEYGMPQLLKKCINQMDSLDKAKRMKMSPRFETLSDKSKSLILERLLEAI